MEKVLARLGRDNHLENLMGRLPVLTVLYGVQILFVQQLAPEINVADFAFYMAISIIAFVSALFIHDKYHYVLLYDDFILVYFEPLNLQQKILYTDIEDIIVPSEEVPFSSIILKLKDKPNVALHFIDYPVNVKKVILEFKNGTSNNEEFKKAA